MAARELVENGMDMVIMPTGATEQHGPHLPMNVDYLVAYRIALGVSERTGVPVLPPLPIGHSSGHEGIPGTLSLSPETFQKVVEEIAEGVYTTGFRRLLFLNGHLPNIHPLNCAAVNLRVRHPDFKLQALSWWDITPGIQKKFYGDESYGIPHGNIVETSIMRYFRDDLVDMTKGQEGRRQGQEAVLLLPAAPDLAVRSRRRSERGHGRAGRGTLPDGGRRPGAADREGTHRGAAGAGRRPALASRFQRVFSAIDPRPRRRKQRQSGSRPPGSATLGPSNSAAKPSIHQHSNRTTHWTPVNRAISRSGRATTQPSCLSFGGGRRTDSTALHG